MADKSKDTIYVDVDDEITGLIDKVRASNAKVVALVLPKRASVLQSIVNMKLLKRTADNENKNLVLITSELGLMPLAGAVGLHVAKTLTSKPEIPAAPTIGEAVEADVIDEDMSLPLDDEEKPNLTEGAAALTTVGALADAANQPMPNEDKGDLETVELDNTKEEAAPAVAAEAKKVPKEKKFKVPNFDRFRMLLILGILAIIAIIILAVFALSVWPRASIAIKTNASNVNTNVSLTLDTQAQSVDPSSGDIPAKQASEQKTFSQTVNTTGQKNEGNTASGTVTMTATDCSPYTYFSTYGPQFTIPAGTGISFNNTTYITQNDTTMNLAKGFNNNNCFIYNSSGPTSINAQNPGSAYNAQLNNASVSGFSEVTASGSASGGTDNLVQIVSQADINSASSKISANDAGSVKTDLANQLRGQGQYPVLVTFSSGTPQITSSPNVGDQANTVTVTETITYTMFGASQADLNTLLDNNIRTQTSSNQNIISTGLNQNGFRQGSTNGTTDSVVLSTLAEVGPNISISQIKKEAEGKSAQAIVEAIKNDPDVTSVSVRLSPFWVSSAPNNPAKISVDVAKPTQSAP